MIDGFEFHKDSFKFEVEGVLMRILGKDEAKQFENKEVLRFDSYDPITNKWTRIQ